VGQKNCLWIVGAGTIQSALQIIRIPVCTSQINHAGLPKPTVFAGFHLQPTPDAVGIDHDRQFRQIAVMPAQSIPVARRQPGGNAPLVAQHHFQPAPGGERGAYHPGYATADCHHIAGSGAAN